VKKLNNLLFLLLSLLLFPILSGCFDNSDCGTNNTNVVVVEFFSRETGSALIVNFDSVFAQNNQFDYRSLADRRPLNTYSLPVNPLSDTVTYVFRQAGNDETITITYNRVLNLIHPDCGAEQIYNNIRVVSTTFDSYLSYNNSLRRLNEFNIEIYL
jgi:hypothetical protein